MSSPGCQRSRLGHWCLLVAFLPLIMSCTSRETAVQPVTFKNVADQVGLDFHHGAFRWDVSGDPIAMMGGGLCWLDYDLDGWLDLYLVNSYAVAEAGEWERNGGLPKSTLFKNEKGHFTAVSDSSGTNLPMRGNGCVAADLDLDGYPDLYITTSRVNLLLWNNGDGTFREGATDAGVDAYGWQTAAAVGDLNLDGWPDIFAAGYVDINNQIPSATMGFPNTNYGMRDLLFISNGADESGAVTFREVGEEAGLETADFEYGLGALLTDLDGDGDLDLYIANDTNPNRLYENVPVTDDSQGLGFRLVEIGADAQVNDNNSGMGVASGDMDGDGRFDLFVTNMGPQLHSVYQNQSGSDSFAFADWTSSMGVNDIGVGWTGWGTSWADFDLDGDLDLFVANGTIPVLDLQTDGQLIQLFKNLTAEGDAGKFARWSEETAVTQPGPILARGSAAADYDNDGDIDVAINQIGGQPLLLQNQQQGGNWLTIQLAGNSAGAVVTAVLADGTIIRRESLRGSSYLSSEDPRCHFGLGDARRVKQLTITWPDGSETVKNNVRANQIIAFQRGQSP